MTIVTAQMSVSVDGFYAGPKHTDMQTWLEGPEAAGFFRVTRWAIDAEAWRQRLGFKGGEQNTNSEVIAETFESAGAYVMGRRMADGGEVPWGDDPPCRAPVFVVTNRPRRRLQRRGGTSFTYVTDGIESAIEKPAPQRMGGTWRSPAAARCSGKRSSSDSSTSWSFTSRRSSSAPGCLCSARTSASRATTASSSPRLASSPPRTSHTFATRSKADTGSSSTTEDETRSPQPRKSALHEAAWPPSCCMSPAVVSPRSSSRQS